MVEVIASVALLAGLGVAVMTISDNQKKAEKGLDDKSELSRALGRVGELISDPNNCRRNFMGKDLREPVRFQEIKDRNNKTIVAVGEKFERGNYVVREITLRNYDSDKNRIRLSLNFELTGSGTANRSMLKNLNFYARVNGTVISECLDPIEQTAFGAMMKSCYDVDPEKRAVCDENFDNLLREVKRIYCGSHPILTYDAASEKCLVLDARKTCPGGYVKGFSASGALTCYPGPAPTFPPPDFVVLPSPPCSWTPWVPATSTVCSGTSLTQTRTCPTSGATESQFANGTKVCTPPCSTAWSTWAPDAASVCTGLSLIQNRNRSCPTGPESEAQTVSGTKSCPVSCSTWGAWGPDPAGTCAGTPLTQTRTCSDGSTQIQSVLGTNASGTCCQSWGDWTPAADTVCCESSVTQSRTCLDAGNTSTESRSVSGTKITGSCGGSWAPATNLTCSTDTVTQTNSCGITRIVSGTKTCGCVFLQPAMWNDNGLQCAEYPNPPPFLLNSSIIIPEGETHYMNAGWCNDTSSGCWGRAQVKCVNGTHVWGASFCQRGYEP